MGDKALSKDLRDKAVGRYKSGDGYKLFQRLYRYLEEKSIIKKYKVFATTQTLPG